MYTLYNKYLPLSQCGYTLSEHLGTVHKVEFRYIDLFACQQVLHLLIEEPEIHRSEALEIRLTVRSERRLCSLDKVVVCSEVQRFFIGKPFQLRAQTLGSGSLSAA